MRWLFGFTAFVNLAGVATLCAQAPQPSTSPAQLLPPIPLAAEAPATKAPTAVPLTLPPTTPSVGTPVPSTGTPSPYVAPLYCPPLVPGTSIPGTGMPGGATDPGMGVPQGNLDSQAQQALQGASNPFSQGTESGGLASRSFDNAMFGDFRGVAYQRNVTVTRSVTTTVPTSTGFSTVTQNQQVQQRVNLPLNGRYSGFKMSDQDTPRPTDRVYFGYSYYSNVNPSLNPGLGSIDQHRQTVGIEKTFLEGAASASVRLPFVQMRGNSAVDASNVGDLTFGFKYAFVNDPITGAVRTAGVFVTAPTGDASATLIDGSCAPHNTIIQPWVGFSQPIGDRFYAQGFSSIMVPLGGGEPTMIFNSFSMGWWMIKQGSGDRFTGLVPVTEIHINTPLNYRDLSGAVYVQDQINMTHGLHLVLPRANLGFAVSYPILSPKPFDAEVLVTLGMRF